MFHGRSVDQSSDPPESVNADLHCHVFLLLLWL
jgi:hypothetical protein